MALTQAFVLPSVPLVLSPTSRPVQHSVQDRRSEPFGSLCKIALSAAVAQRILTKSARQAVNICLHSKCEMTDIGDPFCSNIRYALHCGKDKVTVRKGKDTKAKDPKELISEVAAESPDMDEDFLKELLEMTAIERADLIEELTRKAFVLMEAGEIPEAKQHLERASRIAAAFEPFALQEVEIIREKRSAGGRVDETQVVLELREELDSEDFAKIFGPQASSSETLEPELPQPPQWTPPQSDIRFEVEVTVNTRVIGLVPDNWPPNPVFVAAVVPGSLVEAEGVKAGDELCAVNGRLVQSFEADDLAIELRKRPGFLTFRRALVQRTEPGPLEILDLTFGPQQGMLGLVPETWPPGPVLLGDVAWKPSVR
eukprot:g19775.t1